MRRYFKNVLHSYMLTFPEIVVITGDLGYGMFDAIRNDFPDRFINAGASEQAMMAMAVGMSYEGKIPFVYSITPFLLARPYEIIRNYIDHELAKVVLIGGGRDDDYFHDGFSHYAGDDALIMKNFKNIHAYWPETNEEIRTVFEQVVTSSGPSYINLRR